MLQRGARTSLCTASSKCYVSTTRFAYKTPPAPLHNPKAPFASREKGGAGVPLDNWRPASQSLGKTANATTKPINTKWARRSPPSNNASPSSSSDTKHLAPNHSKGWGSKPNERTGGYVSTSRGHPDLREKQTSQRIGKQNGDKGQTNTGLLKSGSVTSAAPARDFALYASKTQAFDAKERGHSDLREKQTSQRIDKQDKDKGQTNTGLPKSGPVTSASPDQDFASNASKTQAFDAKDSDIEIAVPHNDLDLDNSTLDQRDGVRPSRKQNKRNDVQWRTRGSLQDGGVIERHSRVADVRTPNTRKFTKPKKELKVMPDVYIPNVISVSQLAKVLHVKLDRLQRKMVRAGMAEATSHDHVLSSEYASMLALEFNRNPVVDDEAAFDILPPPPHRDPSSLPLRPPIVTIMGHVDHGKTTLLDTLRSASVAKNEAGGITQHIGAFSLPVPSTGVSDRIITFLDTPGHAAFSAMRARGAMVTDIIVLVVAADDGVMPQTKEVIKLIKNEEGRTNVVVAINKVDKPGVDPEVIKKSLLAENLILEDFGGEIPAVQVSGLTGQGLDDLVETISAVAEVAEIRAERTGDIFGYVLESKIHKGLGPIATVLILRGELKQGASLICGTTHARARQLTDSNGKVVTNAYPGMAVTVAGWKEVPNAGDEVLQGKESDIKKAVVNRLKRLELASVVEDAEAINIQRREEREKRQQEQAAAGVGSAVIAKPAVSVADGPKQLRLVIKCDVTGSIEAVVGALQGIGNNKASVKIVRSSVGDVVESDIMLAKATEGIIVAFSVTVPRPIQALAATNHVPILSSNVIYRLMDDVKERVIALLPPIIEHHVTGEATVAQLFDIHLKRKEILKVAGCKVSNGILEKNKTVRVIRAGKTIHENGIIETLRHHKKDMEEIRKDMECGLSIENLPDLQVGDFIQCIQIIEKPAKL